MGDNEAHVEKDTRVLVKQGRRSAIIVASMTLPLPPKKDVALALLEQGSVHVHLDPRAGGVVVPLHFKKQAQLVLQIGLNMAVPIPDLSVEEDGIGCTLSFNRSPFYCMIPWAAVFALVGDDGRGLVWPDSVPRELQRVAPPPPSAAVPESAKAEPAKGEKPEKKTRKKKSAKSEAEASLSTPPKSGKPVLVSLPRGAAAAPVAASKRGEGEEKEGRAHEPPAAKTPGKPKRELPPYLRVVK